MIYCRLVTLLIHTVKILYALALKIVSNEKAFETCLLPKLVLFILQETVIHNIIRDSFKVSYLNRITNNYLIPI